MQNYVPEDDEHVYIVAFLNELAINHTRFISSEVTNISKRNESVADMKISLTVQSFGVRNETKITCRAFLTNGMNDTTATLYIAGIQNVSNVAT